MTASHHWAQRPGRPIDTKITGDHRSSLFMGKI
jgi:hypothetical protein